MQGLDYQRLPSLPAGVRRPPFDPASLPSGIVHLGVGAFHRAHQAHYTQDALAAEPGPWGIRGVSLRSPGARDRLRPQDCLYTLVERSASAQRATVIGTVREVLFAPQDPAAVLAALAAPGTRIVSLTVTEKGYCHDPASGRLRMGHADVVHDLAQAGAPRSAIGFLVRALALRRACGAGPVTVLCCDNLPENGRMLEQIVLSFARRVDQSLARWIADRVTFPCTMVDRIVPATQARDVRRVGDWLGYSDRAPVLCEDFRQWVVEDRFAAGRPAWDQVGVELVADVAPYETLKLRLLNGSHSALAYLGYLAGFETVAEAVGQHGLHAYVRRLMDEEVAPTLRVPAGVDLAAYQDALVRRFANPALAHRTWQIAMDGSQKLPQRLLGTVRDRLAAGAPLRCLALAVAAWMRYVTGTDEVGKPIEVCDPMAARLARIGAVGLGDAAALVRGYLGVREVFGEDLPGAGPFVRAVTEAMESLASRGAQATVEAWVRAARPPLSTPAPRAARR